FDKYATLGQKLIDLHLLKTPVDNFYHEVVLHNGKFVRMKKYFNVQINANFDGDFIIEKIKHNNDILNIYTTNNKRIEICPVNPDVYNFEIGSYKPIEKWLKYRIKDKVALNASDIQHLKNMIIAIKNTIQTMQKIEELGEEYLVSP
ncbi:MAG: hypothetical protein LBS69_06245, partial [Prevotellaceae bacterium]|nr:hypothetical protein [Prevotellaceae bacterium]